MVCSFGTDSEEIDTSSNAEAVRKLNARRDLLEENIERYYDVSGMMMTYARSLTGSSLGPQQAETFFESLLSRSCAMASARVELDEEITQLERQTDALSYTKTKKQGRTDREVSVVIMAKKATDIELRLTYRMLSTDSSPRVLTYSLTALLFPSCSKCNMVCCIRATCHHGSRRTCTIGIPTLPCPHHTKHRRRLDRRRAHAEYCRHGPT